MVSLLPYCCRVVQVTGTAEAGPAHGITHDIQSHTRRAGKDRRASVGGRL